MNVSRMGIIMLIIGLVLLLNSWSSHVPNYASLSSGEVEANETLSYSVLIAPVGIGNITVGYRRQPGSSVPSTPGMNDSVVLPVHLVVKNPANQTLIEKDIITPYSFQINFNERGEYAVSVTNKGAGTSSIPMGLIFLETNGNSNREADKFILSIILLICGLALFSINLITKVIKNKGKNRLPPEPLNTKAPSVNFTVRTQPPARYTLAANAGPC